MNKPKLSAKLRDTLTGYEGVAVARLEYLSGAVQFCVVKKVGEDGVSPKGSYIDVQRLEEVEGPTIDVPKTPAPFDLGDRLRDKITGLEGIATAKVNYVNGCLHYGVTPKKEKKEKEQPEAEYIDSKLLELVKVNAVKVKVVETGFDQAPPSSGLSYS